MSKNNKSGIKSSKIKDIESQRIQLDSSRDPNVSNYNMNSILHDDEKGSLIHGSSPDNKKKNKQKNQKKKIHGSISGQGGLHQSSLFAQVMKTNDANDMQDDIEANPDPEIGNDGGQTLNPMEDGIDEGPENEYEDQKIGKKDSFDEAGNRKIDDDPFFYNNQNNGTQPMGEQLAKMFIDPRNISKSIEQQQQQMILQQSTVKAPEVFIESQEPLEWLMEEGDLEDTTEVDFIKEQLKPKDCYVYPMSLTYTSSQKRRMKLLRIIAFLICLDAVVPFDLYIPSNYRLGYFGTELLEKTVNFNDISSNFTFSLENCQVYLQNSGSTNQEMVIQYGYLFETPSTSDTSTLSIQSTPTETCIVNIKLPAAPTPIPRLVFNLTGTQSNILFHDSEMSGVSANFSKGLDIIGDVAFIDIQNHYMKFLNISLQFSSIKLNNIRATYKNVTILAGIYADNLAPEITSAQIFANQSDGNICLNSYGVNSTSNNTCDAIYDPVKLVNGTSISCTVKAFICTKTKNCTMPNINNTFNQYLNISVRDGTIQVKQQSSSGVPTNKYTSVHQLKSRISFASSSLKLMNLTWNNFMTDTASDRMNVLQTIGVNYVKTWLYTNKLALLQAQYWPLAWGSVGLLRPIFERQKVIFIDRYCPARVDSLTVDSEINAFYFNYFPQSTVSQVAFVQDYSIFWRIATSPVGESVAQKIQLSENKTIIACFGLAGAIAFVGALFFVQLFRMAVRQFKRKYNKYLNQQLNLAITKKISARSESSDQQQPTNNLLLEFEKLNKIVEVRGLCSTKFIIMEPEQIAKRKLKFNFSLFQIPAIAFDYFLRKKVQSSLMTFLSSIDECKYQFAPKKMKKSDKTDVSIPLRDFQALYSEFCHRNGYKEINVEQMGNQVLQMYGLSIESSDNQKMPAYTFIRFKTWKEKLDNDSEMLNDDESLSSVEFFLKHECVYSPFENDCIFFHNLRKAYESFCIEQGIQEAETEQIIGSDHMQAFGSQIKEKPLPKFLLGVKRGEALKKTENGYQGLVRKPAETKTQLIFKSTSADGFLPNFLLVILLFAIILIVPLVTPMITYLALSEMTQLQQNVHGQILTFFDFYMTNRLDPWWNNVPYFWYAAYGHGYVLIYLIFACIELISFFMTGYDNNGKFPIKYTCMKKFITIMFQILIGIFIFAYFAMAWFAFVWCLLSAILNPSKFLPYSAAALAFIGTLATKYVIYRARYLITMRQYQIKIAEQLANLINSVIGQMKIQGAVADVAKKLTKSDRPITVSNLQQAIGTKVDPQKQDLKITNGNELAAIATMSMDGLNQNVIKLSTALIIKDNVRVNEFITQLAHELKIDPEFLKCLADIIQSDFNPSKSGKQQSYGVTEKAIKKLFKYLFPQLNIDQFDKLISTILERNPEAIIQLLQNFKGLDLKIFKMMLHIKNKDVSSLKKALFKEHAHLMDDFKNNNKDLEKQEEQLCKLFKILDNLRNGQIFQLLNEQADLDEVKKEITKYLGFNYSFAPLCIIGFNQNSSTLTNQILTQSLKEILSHKGILDGKKRDAAIKQFNSSGQTFMRIERLFLALLYLINGEQIDMKLLGGTVRRNGFEISDDMLELLQKCSITYSSSSFEQVLIELNCAKNRDILKEFYKLMFYQKVNFPNICNKLGILEEHRETFTFLVYLLYNIIQYEMLVIKFFEKPQHKQRQKYDKENFQKQLSVLRKQIKECIVEIQFKHPQIKFQAQDIFKSLDKQKKKQVAKEKKEALKFSKNVKAQQMKTKKGTATVKISAAEEEDEKKKQSDKITSLLEEIFDVNINTKLHQELWNYFIKHDDLQVFGDNKDILLILRAHAIILNKVDSIIPKDNDYYKQACKQLAKFYDIQDEKFELIIDIISGNPRDIFKIISNKLNYNIKDETTFQGTFDPVRINLLSQLLNGSRKALTTACFNWYHQYKYFEYGKNSIPDILNIFNISYEFINIIKTKRLTTLDDDSAFYQQELESQIREYLMSQLNEKLYQIQCEDNGYLVKALEEKFKSYAKGICTTTEKYFKNDFQAVGQPENIYFKRVHEIKLQVNKRHLFATLKTLIRLKSYDPKLIDQLIEMKSTNPEKSHKFSTLLAKILEVSGSTKPHKYIKILNRYSKCVPIFTVTGNWGKKEVSIEDRAAFCKFTLLLFASQFNTIFNKSNMNVIKMNKVLVDLVTQSNKATDNDPEVFQVEEKDFNRSLQALYENYYFIDIADRMFECLHQEESSVFSTNKNEVSNNMLGVLLGSALNDKSLVIDSISACLKDQDINLTVLEGIGAILTSNIDYRDQIMYLCNQLEIDGYLLIKLMDLKSSKPQNLSAIVMDLFKHHDEEQSKICTAFIYTIKGDLSLVKVLAQEIGVDSALMTALFASAQGNFSLLGEFYSLIQEKLSLSSQQTVRYLLQLAHGDSSIILQLSQKRSKNFQIYNTEIVDALYTITYIGRRMFTQQTNLNDCEQIKKLEPSLNAISKKLASIFKLEKETTTKFASSLRLIVKSCWGDNRSLQQLYKKFQKNTNQDSIWHNKSKDGEVRNTLTEYYSEKEILKYLKQCLRYTAEQIIMLRQVVESKHKTMLKKLKKVLLPYLSERKFGKSEDDNSEETKKQEELLEEEQKKIGEVEEQEDKKDEEKVKKTKNGKKDKKQKKKNKKKIKKNKKYDLLTLEEKFKQEMTKNLNLYKFYEKYKTPEERADEAKKETLLDNQKPYSESNIKDNRDNKDGKKETPPTPLILQKQMFQVGCTFGYTLHKMIDQPLWYCMTCSQDMEEETLGVCICCMEFCHRGHQLVQANYGQPIRSICDCGAGNFDGCSTFDNARNIFLDVVKERLYSDQNKENLGRVKTASDANQIQANQEKKKKKEKVMKCSILRQNFKMLKSDIIAKIKTKNQKQSADFQQRDNDMYLLEEYKKFKFIGDLSSVLNLQKYFVDPELAEKMSKYITTNTNTLVQLFWDSNLIKRFTLAENIILMAFGQASRSFLTFFGNKDGSNYKVEDYDNQDPYIKAETTNSVLYNTILGFVAIAQGDYGKIQHYGIGLAEVLGEKGTKDLTAQDKFSNIIRIAQGSKLPQYDPDLSSSAQLQRNSYGRIFKELFGINGKSVMIMHYLLTLSNIRLNEALGLEEDNSDDELDAVDNDGPDVNNYEQHQLRNLQLWVENELFNNFLQLTDKSIDFCTSIIGIICNNEKAFDFIAKEKDITSQKSAMYKALLITKKQSDLLPIFQSLSSFVPVNLLTQLRKVFKGDMKSIIQFLIKLISLGSYEEEWSAVENFDVADQKLLKNDKEKSGKRELEYKYLQKLYLFMIGEIGDTADIGKNLECIWSVVFSKKIEEINADTKKRDGASLFNKLDKFKKRIVCSLLSIIGFLYNEFSLIAQIVPALELDHMEGAPYSPSQKKQPKLPIDKFQALLALTSGSWQTYDLKQAIQYLMKNEGEQFRQQEEHQVIGYCWAVLKATNGDLVALAQIIDEVILDNNTHLRSFIVSSVTGQTKFDRMAESRKARSEGEVDRCKNLLLREAYRIYEKIARESYKDNPNLEEFIDFSFQEKVPLHMTMLLSNDRNFVEKLFSLIGEFIVNRKDFHQIEKGKDEKERKEKEAEIQKKLKQFIDFMNPYNSSVQMKPVLKQMEIFDTKVAEQGMMQIKKVSQLPTVQQDHNKMLGIEEIKVTKFLKYFDDVPIQPYFKMNRIDLTQMFFDAFSMDRIATNYFQSYVLKQHSKSYILQNILQIIHRFIEEKPFFDYLNSLILFAIVQPRIHMRESTNDNTGHLDENGNVIKSQDNKNKLQEIFKQEDIKKKAREKDQEEKQKFSLHLDQATVFNDKLDPILINQIKLWFEAITMVLSRDVSFDQNKQKKKFYQIFEGFFKYHERQYFYNKITKETQQHPLYALKNNLDFIVDVTVGFNSLMREDFLNMKPLAIKIGGFPEKKKGDKLDLFIKFVRDNKNIITFDKEKLKEKQIAVEANQPPQQAAPHVEEVQMNSAPIAMPMPMGGGMGAPGMGMGPGFLGDDPMKLIVLPKSLYERFTNKKGQMSFDEFKNFVRLLGLNVSDAEIFKIFSMADKNKTGELDFPKFKEAIIQLKNVILRETLAELGLQLQDLAVAGTFAIVILLLLFGFIFVGIEAFAPSSSFSSVSNTSLPLVAAGAVNSNNGQNDEQEDIDITSSSIS